jgi:hypothetical protein
VRSPDRIEKVLQGAHAFKEWIYNRQPIVTAKGSLKADSSDRKAVVALYETRVKRMLPAARRALIFWDEIQRVKEGHDLSERQRIKLSLALQQFTEVTERWITTDKFIWCWLATSAFGRDLLIRVLLHAFSARFPTQMKLLVDQLEQRWDKADKGRLHKSESGVQALNLLRLKFVYRQMKPSAAKKLRYLIERRLSKLDSLALEAPNAVANAGRLVAMRRQTNDGMTEEDDPRTDLIFWAVLRELYGAPRATWKEWLEIAPRYKSDPRNFKHRLKRWGIPFESVGQFRGSERGDRGTRAKKKTHKR